MNVTTLQKLLIEELKDLYSAEKQLTKAMPKMAKKASSPKLKKAIEKHLEQTKEQVVRLEQVFELLGEKPKAKKCKAMEGLVEEAQELMQEDIEPEVLDAGLIAAAQRIEHYEMAGYGCVRTYASLLGHTKAAKLLQKTLDEEGKTDQLLTQLAETTINLQAAQQDDTTRSSEQRKTGTTRKNTTSGRTANAPAKAKKKVPGRRKPTLTPTRTSDQENYEGMMAQGSVTGTTRDTIGNDAQNIYNDELNRNRTTGDPVDVEREQSREEQAYNERGNTGTNTHVTKAKKAAVGVRS
jgi:ferritin-like metal-binding protein YciE